jgi:predicted DNA-binding protein (MmcQ/YjbR family)
MALRAKSSYRRMSVPKPTGMNLNNFVAHPTIRHIAAFDRRSEAMPVTGAGEQIYRAVTRWEEIAHALHRFGGTEFRVGRREVGHVHGDRLVDIPFPLIVRDELVESGAAEPHHVLPKSGWVSIYLRNPADIDRAIRLLRRSYEIALAAKTRSTQPA